MACDKCGQRKGHMDGCPLKSGDKAGSKHKKTKDTEKSDRGLPPLCMQTSGGPNEDAHPGIRHICAQNKNHGGSHKCTGCSATW